MSQGIRAATPRSIGNALIGVPNRSPRRGEEGYRAPSGETNQPAVVRWLTFYSAHLSGAAAAAGAAFTVHPLLWAAAAVPLGFLGVSEVERLTNNARVRAQRPEVEADREQATPAGRAVAA